MPFSTVTMSPKIEMYLGAWTDITKYVRLSDSLTIRRGMADESTQPMPGTCTFTLANQDLRFSPKNPTSPYYGQLRRNTPARVSLRCAQDTFDGRTVASSWGTSTSGDTWSTTGSGGSVLASDWNVTGGAGTQSVPVTTAYRLSYLPGAVYRDIDVTTTVSVLSGVAVTGGAIEPANLVLRGLSVTNYLLVRVTIETDQSVKVGLLHYDGTVYAAAVTVPGLVHGSNQLTVRAQVEGQSFRAKVWDAATGEPFAWSVETLLPDTVPPVAGWVGVRSGVSASNSNTKPIVFSHDTFEVRSTRFAGEIADWPHTLDVNDAVIGVTAAGPLRRISQGNAPLQSALRRNAPSLTGLVAYWPCEDGVDSVGIAPGMDHGQIMGVNNVFNTIQFAAYSGFEASDAIPITNGSWWSSWITGYASTGKVQLRFLVHVPSGGDTDGSVIASIYTNGGITTNYLWEIIYLNTGNVRLKLWDNPFVSSVMDSGILGADINGKDLMVSLELQNTGGNIGWTLGFIAPGATGAGFFNGTVTGAQIGSATSVNINPALPNKLNTTAVGQITVQNTITSFFDRLLPLDAYRTETAMPRMVRLTSEENESFAVIDVPGASEAMGFQRITSLKDLLLEAAEADQGVFYEQRSSPTLAYRQRSTMYNQPAAVTVDFSLLSTPFVPTMDDQQTRNEVTVTRPGGSSYTSTVTTGPLSTQKPPVGVGPYPDEITVNVASDTQLPDQASWRTTLGTVDEMRVPKIKAQLNSALIAANPLLALQLLDLNVGDRVLVQSAEGYGIFDDISQIARGFTETIRTFEVTVEATCSPESPFQVISLDSVLGRLDSDRTTTGSTTMTTTSNSLTLAGDTWTTTDVPFDVMVAGEQMTVTAVSGGSPQVATVTRSVNGVVKEHGNNEPITLARPARLAF
jgi:hypothetical protein